MSLVEVVDDGGPGGAVVARKQFLCPREFRLKHGCLVAGEVIQPGTTFLPWVGEVRQVDEEPLLVSDEEEVARRYYGLLDSPTACNWLLFLTPARTGSVPNLEASCCPSVGTPRITVLSQLHPGTKLVCLFSQLPASLLLQLQQLPPLALLRSALLTQLAETSLREAPLDLSHPATSPPSTAPTSSPGPTPSSPSTSSPPHTSSPFSTLPSLQSAIPAPFSIPSLPSPTSHFNPTKWSNFSPLSFPSMSPSPPPQNFSPPPAVTKPKREWRSNRRALPCPTCGKHFDRPSLLERHLRIHTGEKPYVCDFCKKGFSTSSSLNTHRRIHTGEKPHKCETCGKSFTASSNLYYHRMTHIKDKPHPCPECPRSFPTPGDLRHHMKIHSSPSSSPFTFPGNHNQPSSAPSSPSPPSPTSSTDLTAQREAIANLFKTISEEKPFAFFQKDRFDSLVF